MSALALVLQTPLLEPGTKLAYAQAPAWKIETDARLECARHEIQVRIEGDRAHVEAFALLRNPSLFDANGRLFLGQVRQDVESLDWPGKPEIEFKVAFDREGARPETAASSVSLTQSADGYQLLASPVTSTIGYKLLCPAKTETHLVVNYDVPLGRAIDRPRERIFAYDFGPLAPSEVKPRVFVRMARGTSLRLLSVRPASKVVRSANGQLIQIDRIPVASTGLLVIRFER